MIILIDKSTSKVFGYYDNIANAYNKIKLSGRPEQDFFITEEVGMKYISRTTYYEYNDEKKCIYNNKKFWTDLELYNNIMLDWDSYKFYDFLGEEITKTRFVQEHQTNYNRLTNIDGLAGEIDYNQEIGQEFVDIFREECVKTEFKTITPLEIGEKLSSVIMLLGTGSFRESILLLKQIQATDTDAFLTVARLQKYIDMLNAADVITYATKLEYYYNEDGTKIVNDTVTDDQIEPNDSTD